MASLPRRLTLEHTRKIQRVSCVPQPSAMMIPTLNKAQTIPGGATMPLDARSESNNLRGDPHAATEGGRTTRPKSARFFASNAAQKVGKKSSQHGSTRRAYKTPRAALKYFFPTREGPHCSPEDLDPL